VVALLGLRFLLQLAQANYYNPISQGINRFVAPIIGPFASLPTVGSVNFSVLAAAVVVQGLGATLCFLLLGGIPGVVQLIVWSVLSVFGLLLDLVFYALIGMIILSWLAPNASHPGAEILMQVSEPFMAPFRKIMPDMGGLDLSPILLLRRLSSAARAPWGSHQQLLSFSLDSVNDRLRGGRDSVFCCL
jgi:YggT family protein